MTQQPYYPQQPQGYPPPAPYQQPPMQPQYPAYPQQAPYQQPYAQPAQQQPQAAPAQPVVTGTLSDFYNQPSAAGGPGISWKDKPLGTTYAGIIAREPRVQQDTDFDTGRPLFQKDQVTPKFIMLIPLTVQPTQEFPEGEVVFYVRGQAREELVRAMAEAGCSGAPKVGAGISITLTQRRPNRKGNPSNIVGIRYMPPNGVPHNDANQPMAADAPSPAPAAQEPVQPVQPVQAQQTAVPGQPLPEVPQSAYPAGAQQLPPVQQQVPGQIPGQAAPQYAAPVQQQVPQQQGAPQGAPQPPADLSADQQALLARLTGQQG